MVPAKLQNQPEKLDASPAPSASSRQATSLVRKEEEVLRWVRRIVQALKENLVLTLTLSIPAFILVVVQHYALPSYSSTAVFMLKPGDFTLSATPNRRGMSWLEDQDQKTLVWALDNLNTATFRQRVEKKLGETKEGKAIIWRIEHPKYLKWHVGNPERIPYFGKRFRYLHNIDYFLAKNTNIQLTSGNKIRVSVESAYPGDSILVANLITQQAIEFLNELNLLELTETKDYIADQLSSIEKRIVSIEGQIQELRQKNPDLIFPKVASETASLVPQAIAGINEELRKAKIEQYEKQKLIETFKKYSREKRRRVERDTGLSTQGSFSLDEGQVKAMQVELVYLDAKVKALEEVLEKAQKSRNLTIEGMLQNLGRRLVLEHELFSVLQKQEHQTDFMVISLKRKMQQLDPADSTTTGRTQSLFSKLWMAIFLCLLTSLGIIFGKEFLFPRVKSDKDFLELGVATLGSIPDMKFLQKQMSSLATHHLADAANNISIHHIGTRLIHMRNEWRVKNKHSHLGHVVCLLSSQEGEGKSFVSQQVAEVLAKEGEKTILIDGDLRKSAEDRGGGQGLSVYLTGREGSLHSLKLSEKLDCIPAGAPIDLDTNPFSGKKFSELVQKLREEYDFVVIDTPPLLLFSDGVWVSGLANVQLLVATHQYTFIEDLKRSLERLYPVVGVNLYGILNKEQPDIFWRRFFFQKSRASVYYLRRA